MKTKTRQLKGLPVSPGIAIGTVHLIESQTLNFPKFWISDRETRREIVRFQQAIKKTQQELTRIKEKLCRYQIGDQVSIIDSHQMIARDELIIKGTTEVIHHEKINAEWAFDKTLQKLKASFSDVHDDYFKERYNEIDQVARRVFLNLLGSEGTGSRFLKKDSVIVARDLSPAETAQMIKGMVQGFITETGGSNSHTAIVARGLEIPAVVGIEGMTHMVKDGDPILIDGILGTVLIQPSKSDLVKYGDLRKEYQQAEQTLLKEAHLPSLTQDGYRLRLAANMEILEEIPSIKTHGAEGIGLYRTEMLYLSRKRAPTEEEQFETYKKVLKRIAPSPATIRTLDIGGDKVLADSDFSDGANPALGLRGIRYCLKERSILKTQLRALLRASKFGTLKILIPMVTNLEEIRQVKKVLSEVQQELTEKKISFDSKVKLGAMVEIPSAALIADDLANEMDFLSIGTNDLIQYTLAVDRVNEAVSYLYEPLHPAVIRLLRMICDAGKSANIDVSLCGEMAGNPLYFLILLGLGLSELSMNPVSIPRVRKLTRSVTFRQAKDLLDKVLHCETSSEIEHLIRREAARIEGFPAIP